MCVSDHRSPITIRCVPGLLDGLGSGSQCPRVDPVDNVNVHVQERRERFPVDDWSDHYQGVADEQLGWSPIGDLTDRTEGRSKEFDLPRDVGDRHARCDRSITLGWFSHLARVAQPRLVAQHKGTCVVLATAKRRLILRLLWTLPSRGHQHLPGWFRRTVGPDQSEVRFEVRRVVAGVP